MSLETKVIKSRLGLLSLAEELGNVSRACKYLGYRMGVDTSVYSHLLQRLLPL
jgi:hypothetical protein